MNTKKWIGVALAVILLSSISLTYAQTTDTSYKFTQNITIGSTGSDVTALQQILINDGFLTSVSTPTGYFGVGTAAALTRFQAANGISPASGYFGLKSRTFMNQLAVSSQATNTPQNTTSNNTPNNQSNTPPPNGTLCNGTYYSACPTGENFVCPATGGAYCQTNEQEQAANQRTSAIASYEAELQTYNNDITEDQNEIASIQAEDSQSCSATFNSGGGLSESQGEQGIANTMYAEECDSYEQEINSILKMENQTENDEVPIKNEILYIESL